MEHRPGGKAVPPAPAFHDEGPAVAAKIDAQTIVAARWRDRQRPAAPEQAGGAKDVGRAADVYSVGAILYELLTARPPSRAATPLETIMQEAPPLHPVPEPADVRQLGPDSVP